MEKFDFYCRIDKDYKLLYMTSRDDGNNEVKINGKKVKYTHYFESGDIPGIEIRDKIKFLGTTTFKDVWIDNIHQGDYNGCYKRIWRKIKRIWRKIKKA